MPINQAGLRTFKSYRPDGSSGATALTDEMKLKPVDNDIAQITLFKQDDAGKVRSFLKAEPSPTKDPGRKARILDMNPQLAAELGRDVKKFVALIKKTAEEGMAPGGYFRPDQAALKLPTNFKFNAIVGARADQFYREASALAQEIYGRAGQAVLDEALYAVNTMVFDINSREMYFDQLEINGYASFGHDATFVHAWERRLEVLNKIDTGLLNDEQKADVAREKKQIQGELDAIFREKYVYNNSNMDEQDAETSIGLCLIDRESRARVSETKKSWEDKGLVPEFELLTVREGRTDKAVYWDAQQDKYFFDETAKEVPANLVASIRRTPIDPQSMTFRRAAEGEPLREGFRFDWDGNGYADPQVIDWVAWAGHCNDKASLESQGVVVPEGHEGVFVYDSAAGQEVHYDRNLLNEELLSFSELGGEMVAIDGRGNVDENDRISLTNDQFAAYRDDDRPDILMVSQQTRVPFRDRPNEMTIEKVVLASGEEMTSENLFRAHIVAADERSATPNELFAGFTEGDRVNVNLSKVKEVHASAAYMVYDAQTGQPRKEYKDVVLNLANPPAEPVVVDSVIDDPSARTMYEISLDLKNKKWVAQLVQMEKSANGFTRKEVPGQRHERPLDLARLVASRETTLDNPEAYMDFVKEALQTAQGFTSETALDAGVWNGRTNRLAQAKVWRDDTTKWARVSIEVDARYGGGQGEFLVKLKNDGKPAFFVPLSAPFDFAWRTGVGFAPVMTENGKTYVNANAVSRGIIDVESGGSYWNPSLEFNTEAVDNLMTILHLAFAKKGYAIRHEGQVYYFEDKAKYEAEKAKLDALRKAAVA